MHAEEADNADQPYPEPAHHDVDRTTVLDLLEAIQAEQRYHASAAIMASHPALREHHEALAREDAALIADIRHEMAIGMKRHQSRGQRQRRFDRYVSRLVDIYLDNSDTAEVTRHDPIKRDA